MTQTEILDRLQLIFRDVLDNDSLVVTRQSTAYNTANWDSLAHINLIDSVQDEFHVKFALGELEEMKEVGDLVDLILKKSNN
jgi:acyl carrier protein